MYSEKRVHYGGISARGVEQLTLILVVTEGEKRYYLCRVQAQMIMQGHKKYQYDSNQSAPLGEQILLLLNVYEIVINGYL